MKILCLVTVITAANHAIISEKPLVPLSKTDTDTNKLPILAEQEHTAAGYADALLSLESNLANEHIAVDQAENALADLKASLAVIGLKWPESGKGSTGEIRPRKRLDQNGTLNNSSALYAMDLSVRREAVLRAEAAYKTFFEAVKESELRDARALRAEEKARLLQTPDEVSGAARLAKFLTTHLKLSKSLKSLEKALFEWDQDVQSSFLDTKNTVLSQWSEHRVDEIHQGYYPRANQLIVAQHDATPIPPQPFKPPGRRMRLTPLIQPANAAPIKPHKDSSLSTKDERNGDQQVKTPVPDEEDAATTTTKDQNPEAVKVEIEPTLETEGGETTAEPDTGPTDIQVKVLSSSAERITEKF